MNTERVRVVLARAWAWLCRPVVARWVEPERMAVLELRGWLPVVSAGVALVWYLSAPDAVPLMLLVAIGGMLGAGLTWTGLLARRLHAQRRLRYAAFQVGDELEEEIHLVNDAACPAQWLEVVDQSSLPGYHLGSVRGVDARGEQRWREQILCQQRGVFQLGPWEVRSGDPFGLFLMRQVYTRPQEVVVYPSLAPLPERLLPHLAQSGEHRLRRQLLPADTLNASWTREYQPGDPLHHIHWRTTARRDALHTRMFEPEATSQVWLVLDLDPQVHLGVGLESTEELLVLLAASLAAQLAQRGLQVGLLAPAADGAPIVRPPRAGPEHLWELLRALAPLHATPGQPPLASWLPQTRVVLTPRSLLLVITPSLSADWPRALAHSLPRGAGAEALLLDPASFGGRQAAAPFLPVLARLGLPARVVQRGDVRPLTATYGALRRWDFLVLGTGRAVAVQTPRSAPSLQAQLSALQSRARENAA